MTIKKLRSRLKESESEIENLLRQERMKADFIADATHEFRTPLAIIKGNIDLAFQSKKKPNPSAREALLAIDKEVKHLSGLLSDLSLLTMRGKEYEKNIIFERVNLSTIIPEVIERCRSLVLTNENNISIEVAGKIPPITLYGHGLYLEKLFLNIINNGIIYGKKDGKVTVSVMVNKKNAVIKIKDNGLGIVSKSLPHIFERFYRVDTTRASSHGASMGLGLAISKWITKIHGGNITAQSPGKDKGSTFIITLPLGAKKKKN